MLSPQRNGTSGVEPCSEGGPGARGEVKVKGSTASGISLSMSGTWAIPLFCLQVRLSIVIVNVTLAGPHSCSRPKQR